MKEGSFAAEGILSDRRGQRPGWVTAEDGVVTATGDGQCPVEPDVRGFILTDTVDMHTHCADYGLEVPPGISLEDLVAPPDGLKHRYLRSTPPDVLEASMRRFAADSRSSGSATFVDFREGGAEGCRMLRRSAPDAVILGRPTAPEFDPEEVASILETADGIGIPSPSDMDWGYIEAVADAVRDERRIFAIHVSERVREDIDFVLSLDPAFVVHMCEADDDDLAKCAEAEVPVVVCPTSNAYFGKACPASRVLSNGADLALGTDNGMLCRPDMLDEAEVLRGVLGDGPDAASDAVRALARASGKILNAVSFNQHRVPLGPVTVLPTPQEDAEDALRLRGKRIVLDRKEARRHVFQEHSGTHRRKRIHQGRSEEGRRARPAGRR